MKNLDLLKESNGSVIPLISPSGKKFVIRMQNGDDDDIISNAASVKNGTSIVKFLSKIIVDTELTPTGTITPEELSNLRLADIYYLLIASRIFSMGHILSFEYKWDDIDEPVTYEENLEDFIWDYEKPFPFEPTDEHYNLYRIKPIPPEVERSITLRSGKVVSYSFMNTHAEKYLTLLTDQKQSKNQEIFARKLRQKTDTGWVVVESFKFFSPMDMADIRKDIEENDPELQLVSEIKHPTKDRRVFYPIVANMDFFFPRVI